MRKIGLNLSAFALVTAMLAVAIPASAETRITYKSAKTTSSYYQMGVQISEAMKSGSDGEIIVTVEESQGSVQNVMEVKARGGDYVFTTPPVLVKLAQGGKAMFEGKSHPKFDEIRALLLYRTKVASVISRAWKVKQSCSVKDRLVQQRERNI